MKKESEEGWASFLALCTQMKTAEALEKLFSLFLTFEEREMVAARLLIIKSLLENTSTQREIAEKYTISIAQITRGSNALKSIDPELKETLWTLLQKQKKEAS
jgi:TrpR family trp operon transcriptional repressor